MGGFNIGFGVGLRYSAPRNKKKIIYVPPEGADYLNVIISESGAPLVTEQGYSVKLEQEVNTVSETSVKKTSKSYWNF